MDPEVTLQAIENAIMQVPNADHEEVLDKILALDRWLSRGGFKPERLTARVQLLLDTLPKGPLAMDPIWANCRLQLQHVLGNYHS